MNKSGHFLLKHRHMYTKEKLKNVNSLEDDCNFLKNMQIKTPQLYIYKLVKMGTLDKWLVHQKFYERVTVIVLRY